MQNNRITNPLAKYNSLTEKSRDFVLAQNNGEYACDVNGRKIPLMELSMSDVEFIGGIWRVQQSAPGEIINVRDQQFILGKKLDVHEKNQFEYFNAHLVAYNCYGPFINPSTTHIVGRFIGGKDTYLAYGLNIPQVRSFLAIALFDRHQEMIFLAERKNKIK